MLHETLVSPPPFWRHSNHEHASVSGVLPATQHLMKHLVLTATMDMNCRMRR